MATDKQITHARAIAAKRSAVGTVLKKSEKYLSDAARLKQETEAADAARKWDAAMELEGRRRK